MNDARFDVEFVERIVREVMRRLLERGLTVTSSNRAAADHGPSELALTENLVTLETLRDRLAGIRRVTVGRKAVVTPAARDELKQKRIELLKS